MTVEGLKDLFWQVIVDKIQSVGFYQSLKLASAIDVAIWG